MGNQTDWIGYLEVTPPLNETEVELVNRLSKSIFKDRRSSGVRAVDELEAAIHSFRRGSPPGQSAWGACPLGCCLRYEDLDQADDAVAWLTFLIDTFFAPGAAAASVPELDLTCDHVLNGMVVRSRRDRGRLYSITVRDSAVVVEHLWPGTEQRRMSGPLAYHKEIDRFRRWVVEHRGDEESTSDERPVS